MTLKILSPINKGVLAGEYGQLESSASSYIFKGRRGCKVRK